SVKVTDDPLRDDPVATIDNSCVACGNCGEVADAAVLCPSFYRADVLRNAPRWSRLWDRLRRQIITALQSRREAGRALFDRTTA
ncbi:MAG: indolepyruvate ferredoxin oxidoreductase, partial [Aestuariivirga sp.]